MKSTTTTAGLVPINLGRNTIKGVPMVSPIASQAEMLARRRSERLEMASSEVPVCTSTMREPYKGTELNKPHRPGCLDAFALPSLGCFTKPAAAGRE